MHSQFSILNSQLYIHFPFCLSKCNYCALYSEVKDKLHSEILTDFPKHIAKEFELRYGKEFAPETIYFGGGTPGLLGHEGLTELVTRLKDAGVRFDKCKEWTVELNPSPEITTPELLETFTSLGVNRLSFGAQSLDDEILRLQGRRHSAQDVENAFTLARSAGITNIGLDLIAGYPNVSDAIWNKTIEKATSLLPKHLSVYGLIIEPETKLANDIKNKKLSQLSPDDELDILAKTETVLSEAGFIRYEISNYALPGFECRHNFNVWQGEDYLGLGPAAASRISLNRHTNLPDINLWHGALSQDKLPPAENDEIISPAEDAEERFIYGLRTHNGVSPKTFAGAFPAITEKSLLWEQKLKEMIPLGLIYEVQPEYFALTGRGKEVADCIMATLLS